MTVVATDQAMVGMVRVTATSTLMNTDMGDMDMDMDITIIAEGAARAVPVVAAKEAMEVTRRSIINIIRDVGSCDGWRYCSLLAASM